mgnify:CR=1 FL=1
MLRQLLVSIAVSLCNIAIHAMVMVICCGWYGTRVNAPSHAARFGPSSS